MGAAIATATQADAARGQGGASNLQRFKAHHPPTFTGGGDPMVADHWFRQIERILRAMEITSDTTRITLASFQLVGESQIWWEWVTTSRDLETMSWDDFRRLFMGKYFPASARHAKAREFLELRHGTMTVLEYVARFTELARFGDDYVATNAAKVRKFEDGLKLSIRGKIVGHNLQDMDSMVSTALIIEREIENARSVTPRIPARPDWRIRTDFRNARLRTGTLYLIFFFFFFFKLNWYLWVWPTTYNIIKILYTYN